MSGAWANQAAWTVLDTHFGDGQHFLSTWLAWQRNPQRSRMLHYVGIAPFAPDLSENSQGQGSDHLPDDWQTFIAQCKQLALGFHRIILDGGNLSLTLCIGDLQTQLREHVFQADTVFAFWPEDKWEAQLLARRCKRGTRLCMALESAKTHPDTRELDLLHAAGFQMDEPVGDERKVTCTFDPHWKISTSRKGQPHSARPARCAVVGAGIAGASVAHALALRGWDVTVYDKAPSPAAGASGLPAGLAVPHVSADDNPRARLSRNGCRLLAQHADLLLVQGQDWDPCGVLEHRPDGNTLWHADGCWIKPAKLVRAWLAHPGVHFAGNNTVAKLENTDGLWHLNNQHGQDLGQFEVVVLANAMDSATLLAPDMQQALAGLQAVHGTLSYGSSPHTTAGLPATPVNGNGCFIPKVPGADGNQWFAGSTFETNSQLAADIAEQHTVNMARLRPLLPTVDMDWVSLLDQGRVGQWSSTRCVTHDRLPLLGPVEAGPNTDLWLCVGMGSRGLSFSALCAELLAARLGGEPLPVEFSLSRSLDVSRVQRRSPSNTNG